MIQRKQFNERIEKEIRESDIEGRLNIYSKERPLSRTHLRQLTEQFGGAIGGEGIGGGD
jgi:hypothetical protein